MVQLITNIGIDFPEGIAVHDIVRAMIKDNWDNVSVNPPKAKIRFTDVGWLGNFNYQISTVQLPYKILRSSGSGRYQHIQADVELNLWVRRLGMRKPGSIQTMMNRISEIVQEHHKDLSTGIIDNTIRTLASGMDHIMLTEEFTEPAQRSIQLAVKRPTETIVWHTQGLISVWFFRYIT